MTTFYLDYVNGNDAADGSTFALGGLPTVGPWKTITGGPTAARIAPGDVIKIAKSPDPTSLGQTALWTNLSRDVVLQTGAVTAEIDNCESANSSWTKSTNITGSDDTSQYKLGANSLKLAVGVSFTTGKAAYRDFGAGNEKDLSGYQQISFWIRNSVALASAGDVKVKLCSDAAGDTPVDTFNLPAIPSVNQWIPITVDKAAALGSSIRSVAVYMDTDLGAMDLYFDNIIACKDKTAADSLTLQSLISKNSAAQGGTEPWYAIQSINGTTIKIDNHTNQLGNGGRGYTGTTETVTIYKRETIKTAMVATSSVVVQQTNEAGVEGSINQYQGGYNTSSGSQDGETFFDGLNGFGYGLQVGYAWSTLNRINPVRYQRNTNFSGLPLGVTVDNQFSISPTGDHYGQTSYNSPLWKINNLIGVNSGSSIGNYRNHKIGTLRIYGSAIGSTASQISLGPNSIIDNLIIKNSAGCAFLIPDGLCIVKNLITADNAQAVLAAISSGIGPVNILASSIDESTIVYNNYYAMNFRVNFRNFNGVSGDHRSYTDYGEIDSESSVRHTASGLAWKLMPKSTNRNSWYPLDLKIAEVAVNANAEVTVKAWLRRSNTGLTMSLVCRGGQIAGVANDVVASMTAAADTWEEVTLTFTPTEAGVVEIEVWAYGGTTYSGYVDDMTFDQAA